MDKNEREIGFYSDLGRIDHQTDKNGSLKSETLQKCQMSEAGLVNLRMSKFILS